MVEAVLGRVDRDYGARVEGMAGYCRQNDHEDEHSADSTAIHSELCPREIVRRYINSYSV